jgi:3-oxoacyl-[acyl-carrier protein] reductase
MRLKDKVALVTGAQQGIGKAIAVAFGREGAHVVVNYLDDETAAQAVVAEIEGFGVNAQPIRGDVTRAGDVEAMMAAADRLGGLDILVNNAGIFPRVAFLDLTEDDWDRVLTVNLKAVFFCAQAGARRMVARGGGAIINIASSAAYSGPPLGVHYAASKAGIVGMTRAAAMALAPHGVRVNAIAPGLTDTAQPRDGGSEEEVAALARNLPLGRIIEPAEIADAAVFLAAPESRQMTGQTMHVNGGQLLG